MATEFLDTATECIPTWVCDNDFHKDMLKVAATEHNDKGEPLIFLKTDPIKGKGLFAARDIEADSSVLVESALLCAQNLEDINERHSCLHCLKSLETPREIVTRLCGKETARLMPKKLAGFTVPSPIACSGEEGGCTMSFCNETCRHAALMKHHYVGCRGRMTKAQKDAYDEFEAFDWVHNGVDLSDTAWLALTGLFGVLTRHRLHRLPLDLAFFPYGQLIHSGIDKFAFTYLVADEWEEAEDKAVRAAKKKGGVMDNSGNTTASAVAADGVNAEVIGNKTGDEPLFCEMSEEEKRQRRWKMFIEHKDDPRQHPALRFQLDKDDPEKAQFVAKSLAIVHTIVAATDAEKAFLSAQLWSNLLSAVLLNGQERAPASCFTEFMKVWKAEDADAAREFAKAVRKNKGSDVSMSDFEVSSRGQGIYQIGSCFNHSCDCNLQMHYSGSDDEQVCAVAMRDIKAGEELFISYIDENAPLEDRQRQLFEHYLFTCACTKCTTEIDAKKKRAGAASSSPARED